MVLFVFWLFRSSDVLLDVGKNCTLMCSWDFRSLWIYTSNHQFTTPLMYHLNFVKNCHALERGLLVPCTSSPPPAVNRPILRTAVFPISTLPCPTPYGPTVKQKKPTLFMEKTYTFHLFCNISLTLINIFPRNLLGLHFISISSFPTPGNNVRISVSIFSLNFRPF